MRKNMVHLFAGRPLLYAALLFIQPALHAQVSNPSTWETFVAGKSNVSTRDTFLTQTFAQSPTDNWAYTTTGDVSIVDLAETIIPDAHGPQGLRMPMSARVNFEHFPLDGYEDVIISVHKGGASLMPGEAMYVLTYREGDDEPHALVKEIKPGSYNSFSTTTIDKNPPGIDLFTPEPAADTEGGYYIVDSVCAHGLIPAYSLFAGDGSWDEPALWSHKPAYRHRHALIQGNVRVDRETTCGTLAIGEGSLRLEAAGELSTLRLTIYSDDTQAAGATELRSAGSLAVQETATVVKTFAQKGEWYFLSLPFDVYADGIDPDFQLGDDSDEMNGNYFYLRTYDGEKRASSQSAADNWVVVPRDVAETSRPVLEKNKGYLIALDASADSQTLRFTSAKGALPDDFGRKGEVSIQVSAQGANPDHGGWYLCGNPLPASLPLSQIEPNDALDGYIYLYDGTAYQPHAIGSDGAIPPYSAFFVKAERDTRLTTRESAETGSYSLLSVGSFRSAHLAEPTAARETTVANAGIAPPAARLCLNGNQASIDNLPSDGHLRVLTPAGKIVYERSLRAGDTVLSLPLKRGLYLLVLQAGEYHERRKCLIRP